MVEETKCILCQADFRPNAMVGNKCISCNEKYPKAKSRDDIKPFNPNKIQTLTESRVKELIYEILEEANIKRFPCEKCGQLYFKNSPAQKICLKCKDKETN
jgi:hypothetical protein